MPNRLTERQALALSMFRDYCRKDRRATVGNIVEECAYLRAGLKQSTFESLERRGLIERCMVDAAMPGYRLTLAGTALLPPKFVPVGREEEK